MSIATVGAALARSSARTPTALPELARLEAVRYARPPLFLAGAALTALSCLDPDPYASSLGHPIAAAAGLGLFGLAAMASLVRGGGRGSGRHRGADPHPRSRRRGRRPAQRRVAVVRLGGLGLRALPPGSQRHPLRRDRRGLGVRRDVRPRSRAGRRRAGPGAADEHRTAA